MVDQKTIVPVIEELIGAVRVNNQDQMAQILQKLIVICQKEGLNPEQINLLLQENGLKGGDSLMNFISQQYEALKQ